MAQWLDRVKFGNGKDGAPVTDINTNSGQGWGTVTGTAGQTTLNITDVAHCWRITAGDVILIHQSQGTGAGQWELNVASETFPNSTTASKSVKYPLAYTYGTGAQVIRVPQWTGGTLSGAAGTAISWNGSYGGIYAVMCNGDLTISGTLSVNALGFRGASRHPVPPIDTPGTQGEGYSGYTGSTSINANGNGGGAGQWASGNKGTSGGGGGGNGTAGETAPTAYQNGGYALGGAGGLIVGSSDLTSMFLGGGGGSGACNASGYGGAGGAGGGIILLCSKEIIINGNILSNGTNGENGSVNGAGGGGGAGGSILLQCENATLGSNKINSLKGTYGNGTGLQLRGGDGGGGRITIKHSGIITGTTSPTFIDIQDSTIKSKIYYGMI